VRELRRAVRRVYGARCGGACDLSARRRACDADDGRDEFRADGGSRADAGFERNDYRARDARTPATRRTRRPCGLATEEIVVHGEAATEIVRVARERGVDLIVIASHGRTGWGRWLFGSTAEAVARYAACPVLVVKQPTEGYKQ
jgi:nucleotide-binding universal stress UspA family protein